MNCVCGCLLVWLGVFDRFAGVILGFGLCEWLVVCCSYICLIVCCLPYCWLDYIGLLCASIVTCGRVCWLVVYVSSLQVIVGCLVVWVVGLRVLFDLDGRCLVVFT